MSSRICYAPILKWKKGEKVALEKLCRDMMESILPIIEIVSQSDADGLLTSALYHSGQQVYVDTAYDDDSERSLLTRIVDEAGPGSSVWPVLYYDDLRNSEIATWANNCGHVAVRIPVPEDISGPDCTEMFSTIEESLGDSCEVDLVLDLGPIESKKMASMLLRELTTVLDNFVVGADRYSKVIVACTCFPESLDIEAGESRHFDRYELDLFRKLLTQDNLKPIANRLVFSDYGVTKFTEVEVDFSKLRYGILPKIRYTTPKSYWVLKAKRDRVSNVWEKSVFDMAEEVHESSYFYGESFSYGDREIKKRALNQVGPGNNTDWVTFAVNHHISVVVAELSNLAGS